MLWMADHWGLRPAESSLFLVMCPAPEHFGDTILFTMDEDILEAIFCLDDTFDMDAESLCGLQPEEALRRPSTADGGGQDERPFTQAGLGAQDQVGLEWIWGIPLTRFFLLFRARSHCAAQSGLELPLFLLQPPK